VVSSEVLAAECNLQLTGSLGFISRVESDQVIQVNAFSCSDCMDSEETCQETMYDERGSEGMS
jgi:hypothetical protein